MSYTKFPNDLLEEIPFMNRSESAITAILIRYTYGFHREDCHMTWSAFMRLSGMSKTSVQRGTKEVVKRGYFTKNGSHWRINNGIKMIPEGYQNDTNFGTKTIPEGYQNDTSGGIKMIPEGYQNDTNFGIKTIPYTKKEKESIQTKGERKGRTPYERFEILNQYKEQPVLALESVIKVVVRNPTDTVTINDIACAAFGDDITPDQITRWFGAGVSPSYWYDVSFGKSDGMPPFAKNVLNELFAARSWERAGSVVPSKSHTTQTNTAPPHDPTMPASGQGGAW